MSDDKFTVVLFSYIPLVWGDPSANYLENPKALQGLVENADATAKCAIWYGHNDKHCIAFAVDQAADIKNHLMLWSEGKPNAWFDLIGHQKDGMYSIVLMPKLDKSVERWKLNYQLLNGFPAPKDAKFQLFFKPLNFVTGKPSKMAGNVKTFKDSKVSFGLIDTKNVQAFTSVVSEDTKMVEGMVHEISTYKLKNATNGYIDSMLAGATEDFRKLS